MTRKWFTRLERVSSKLLGRNLGALPSSYGGEFCPPDFRDACHAFGKNIRAFFVGLIKVTNTFSLFHRTSPFFCFYRFLPIFHSFRCIKYQSDDTAGFSMSLRHSVLLHSGLTNFQKTFQKICCTTSILINFFEKNISKTWNNV